MKTEINSLTVAIPTYNREVYLRECLHSLEKQTYKDFSIIIFDNASTYDLNQFLLSFPNLNISVDKNDTNIGGKNNFKKIVTYPFKSEYVILLHDDDTLSPFYFEEAVNFLNSHKKAVWVGSNIEFIDTRNNHKMSIFNSNKPDSDFIEVNGQTLIKNILEGFNIGFGSIIYRSEILKNVKIRDAEFDKWLDRPMIIDMIRDRTVGITNEKFMHYRLHEGQDSGLQEPVKTTNLINLFEYYRYKINPKDGRLFNIWAANNSINAVAVYSNNLIDLYKNLSVFKDRNVFNFKYISTKGLYYLLKFLIKTIKKTPRSKVIISNNTTTKTECLTILTRPPYLIFRGCLKYYIKKLFRTIFRIKRGPDAVLQSLIRGLKSKGVHHIINPRRKNITKIIHVLSNNEALKWAIDAKKEYKISKLIAGPNIVVLPRDYDELIINKNIDTVLVPSSWIKDAYNKDTELTKESQKLIQKEGFIQIWPSGVSIPDGVSVNNNKTVLVFKKDVPDLIYKKVIEELSKHKIPYVTLTYGHFSKNKYLETLNKSVAMIYLQTVESQGLALQEAWSYNVPTLAWNKGCFTYPGTDIKIEGNISAPYLTEEAGMFFNSEEDFSNKLEEFMCRLNANKFSAKDYCQKNLSDESSIEKYLDIIRMHN